MKETIQKENRVGSKKKRSFYDYLLEQCGTIGTEIVIGPKDPNSIAKTELSKGRKML